jgi:hypothetical protein
MEWTARPPEIPSAGFNPTQENSNSSPYSILSRGSDGNYRPVIFTTGTAQATNLHTNDCRQLLPVIHHSERPFLPLLSPVRNRFAAMHNSENAMSTLVKREHYEVTNPCKARSTVYLRRRSVMIALTIVVSLFATGCGPSAVEFNQKIVDCNNRLKQASDPAGKAMETLDIKGAKPHLENSKKVLEAIKEEMKTWKIPNGQSAKNLYAGYEKYLKGQDEILSQTGKVMAMFEDPSKMDPKQMESIVKSIDTTEKTNLAELQNLQRAFAKDHNMILK